jgi:methylenetetrahydrofolate reductase (NADPH)
MAALPADTAAPRDAAASRDPAVPRAPAASPEVTALTAEMVACGSLEMGADTPDDAARIAELLPAGTPVYVNHLPRHPLEHGLKALVALAEANLEPVPHMAARRIGSRAEARAFLSRASRLAGVRKALLVGGDVADPVGPYASAADLLDEDAFAACGLAQIGFAGYPEGHPRIQPEQLAAALDTKLALARARGLEPYVVTQFCFAPNRIVEYCADLARRAPDVPVYVGLAGPATPVSLLRYAQRCGVGASLRALQAEGMRAVRLVTHVDPSDQLTALAQHIRSGSAGNVVGVHLYSFGGVARTAAWMNARITARG